MARDQSAGWPWKALPSIGQLPGANKDARVGRRVTEFPGMIHYGQQTAPARGCSANLAEIAIVTRGGARWLGAMLSAKPWKGDAMVRLLLGVFICVSAGSVLVLAGNAAGRTSSARCRCIWTCARGASCSLRAGQASRVRFPDLIAAWEKDRATDFKQRCQCLGIQIEYRAGGFRLLLGNRACPRTPLWFRLFRKRRTK